MMPAMGRMTSITVPQLAKPRLLMSAQQAAKKMTPLNTAIRQFSVSPVRPSAHISHATIWNAEKILSLFLLGVLPIGVAFPSQAMDGAMAVAMVTHLHWGLDAIVTDYIRPILFGHTIPKLSHAALLVVSAITLGGLFYFNYNDIGIAMFLRKLWAIKPKEN